MSQTPSPPGADIEPENCLAPSRFVDSEHRDIVAFAAATVGDARDDVTRAVRLYYAVRDGIRYNAYASSVHEDDLVASTCLKRGEGFCVAKAVLYAAVLRAQGIPARLGYADVRNHLASARLLEMLGTDIFIYHGYTEVYLNGRWISATPTFNQSLCDKFGVKSLEFDGLSDSLFHPFDHAGQRHMEYVRKRGAFVDVPQAAIRDAFIATYPGMYDAGGRPIVAGDLEAEGSAENAG